MLIHFSLVQFFATLWAVAHQAPLSMGFPRQEHWTVLPSSSPGDLPDPGIELVSPALAGGFFSTGATWGAPTQLCSGYLCWNCVSDHLNLLQTLRVVTE